MRTWLKNLRKANSLSQIEVAAGLGVSQNYYSAIENSLRQKPMTVPMAAKIAGFFAVPLAEVIALECAERSTAPVYFTPVINVKSQHHEPAVLNIAKDPPLADTVAPLP